MSSDVANKGKLSEREACVLAFHEKYLFPAGGTVKAMQISDKDGTTSFHLNEVAKFCLGTSEMLKMKGIADGVRGDVRLYRMHLLLEELGEMAGAMMEGNDEELADAVADLDYVLTGTALSFSIPMDECFREVHKSNMSKQAPTPEDPRMRRKGRGYRPPDIKKALKEGRSRWKKES